MKFLKHILAVAIVLLPAVASAQTLPDPIQFIVAPETPAPNSKVVIEVQGVGSFLGDAEITWTLNGEVALQGAGERVFSFTAGALGSRSTVGLVIDSETQGRITRTFVFSPSLVNMIWEADTSLPPLVRGKPLYSAGSPLRVIAFPVVYNGSSRIAASSLSFQWSVNENPATDKSGLGRNILSFAGDQLQNAETVAVDVYFGNAKLAHGEVTIPATPTGVLLYGREALRGEVIDTAIPAAISLSGKEITIKAEPLYFASFALRNGAIQYAWTLNDQEITGPESAAGVLTLRQTGSGAGAATLRVSVQNQNPNQFVQAAEVLVQMVFGGEQGAASSFFSGPAAALLALEWNPLLQSTIGIQQEQSSPSVTGVPTNVPTTCEPGKICYTPLEPLSPFDTQQGAYGDIRYYLDRVFRLLLTLGSMFAVVMLVVAGINYMTSNVGVKIEKARERMQAALIGLGLLAVSWLILYTINPQLLVFNLNPGQITGAPSSSGVEQPIVISQDVTTYSADSAFARDLLEGQDVQLKNVDGAALLAVPNSNLSSASARIDAFKTGCEAGGTGRIERANGPGQTVFICQQQ